MHLFAKRSLVAAGIWLGVSVVAHAEPSVSDVITAIQAAQYVQAVQLLKEVEGGHPNAPRVHYMMALALSHIPGREGDASRELAAARNENAQLPFADSAEISALEERIRQGTAPPPPAAPSIAQAPPKWFVPQIHRPSEGFVARAIEFIEQNNLYVAGGIGVIALVLIAISFVRKRKGAGGPRAEKRSRKREPAMADEEPGQEAEQFEFARSDAQTD